MVAAVAVTMAIAIAIMRKSRPTGGSRMMPPPNIPAITPPATHTPATMCPAPSPLAKAGEIAKVQAAMTAKAREILRPVARPEARPVSVAQLMRAPDCARPLDGACNTADGLVLSGCRRNRTQPSADRQQASDTLQP
jgi:hypothetical protein